MAIKKILGLDLGTNSIGWAVITEEENCKSISDAGSRILPMDASKTGNFESGKPVSQTNNRTNARGIRRLYERHNLRRERLNRVLAILGFLPNHYAQELNRYGQIQEGKEPKLAWKKENDTYTFLFQNSFEKMAKEFADKHPDLQKNGKKIAYDWTIYYLRKKALTHPITGPELAWILHQFNQKRGYYQARGEEQEKTANEKKELHSLRVVSVREMGKETKGRKWYEIGFENGWIYRRQSSYPLDWEGQTKYLIATTKLNKDGTEATDKDGHVKFSLSVPKEDDWGLRKIATEKDIETSKKTVGEFIYDALLENPDQKILGQLVRVVDRQFYKDELYRILKTQKQFIPELQNRNLYAAAIEALYPQNEAYRNSIAQRDFTYLLLEDVIFYQRPLKSKKSLINNCPYEFHLYKTKDGEWKKEYLKCISQSHPLYEEFRLWQFIENLHIYRDNPNGLGQTECTEEYVVDKDALLQWLLGQKEISEKTLLDRLAEKKTKRLSWNYVKDKTYPAAPVTSLLSTIIKESGGEPTNDNLMHIWHILYSVTDKKELTQALKHYAETHQLNRIFVEKLSKQKPFAAAYGAYSEKATRKLLHLMRFGAYWSENNIDTKTKQRIEHLLTGEVDENISDQVRDKLQSMKDLNDFQGLPLWLAEYVVYDIRKNDTKWEKPEDIDRYIQSFRLHSLNNPIVEQVVMESLRTVRDIWKKEGHIDEIHIELGRELKQNAEQRKNTFSRQNENEKANLRAKRLLTAFKNPDMEIEGVHAYSPSQQELFRIYEEGVLDSHETNEDIQRIINSLSLLDEPSSSDIKKYRLWLDQKYLSPYTGQPIPLGKLFTPAYQIEHVIPQSRFFDDSFSNKVICEAEVNARKNRMLAHEFIGAYGGERITLSGGKVVTILQKEAYEELIKSIFANNKQKQEKLMLDEIPQKFVARQMNDTRYISRLMLRLLSNIVREKNDKGEYEPESTSKNVIACTGASTTRLKKDWGINDVWNSIILPRFERLNKITNTTQYTSKTNNGHTIPNVPILLSKGFQKKRIDHRHHAMDAIVIAFTTRNHVNLLSNESALEKDGKIRYDLQRKLRKCETWKDADGKEHTKFTDFIAPYTGFQTDVQEVLENIVVSFKQNIRVINKSNNHFVRFKDGKKELIQQKKGDNWSIRQSLHREKVFGEINLRRKKFKNLSYALQHVNDIVKKDLRKKLRELIQEGKNEKEIKKYFAAEPDVWEDVDLKHIEVYYFTKDTNEHYYASRSELNEKFTEQYISAHVTDEGIQKILIAHLNSTLDSNNKLDPKLAFSPNGIEKMNANIRELNNGVNHKPIRKVRVYEKANKYAIGERGAKSKKFVEAAKETNLFVAFYEIEKGKRTYSPLSFVEVVKLQKEHKKQWKEAADSYLRERDNLPAEVRFLFMLSPFDLVYLPTEEERDRQQYTLSADRIYRLVSYSGKHIFFLPASVASLIVDEYEFEKKNKMERAITGEMIKETCIPLSVDRLGHATIIND